MGQLTGHKPLVSYAISKHSPCALPRGTVNDQPPKPPEGLTAAQAYRWTIAHRHLAAATQTDINSLDAADRARHFARIRTTLDDVLHLCRELSSCRQPSSDDQTDVL